MVILPGDSITAVVESGRIAIRTWRYPFTSSRTYSVERLTNAGGPWGGGEFMGGGDVSVLDDILSIFQYLLYCVCSATTFLPGFSTTGSPWASNDGFQRYWNVTRTSLERHWLKRWSWY